MLDGKTEVSFSVALLVGPLLGELGPDPGELLLTEDSVTSKRRFLNELTFPSFLLSKGLLLLSVTFCFNLERTFKLGSEAVLRSGKSSLASCAPGKVYLYGGEAPLRGGEL